MHVDRRFFAHLRKSPSWRVFFAKRSVYDLALHLIHAHSLTLLGHVQIFAGARSFVRV